MFAHWKEGSWPMNFETLDAETAECLLAMDRQFLAALRETNR
jgi:hypothetical protein